MENTNLNAYWGMFRRENPLYEGVELPPSFYFCDNKEDADECARLVSRGIKQATTHALQWFDLHGENLPIIGDLAVVTDWSKRPVAVIRTKRVEIVKFRDISAEYAFIEGEGDKSLAYWKRVHWAFFMRELAPHGLKPTLEMELVCEYFETIWSEKR